MLSATISRGANVQRFTDALIASRVRLDTADGTLVTATRVSVDEDSIRLAPSSVGGTQSLPRAKVFSYEVSAGRERARGAKRAAIVGGALGLALDAGGSLRPALANRQSSDTVVSSTQYMRMIAA